MKSIKHNTITDVTTNNSKKNLPGIWLGIDLGTTNTTAAFYSPNNHVSKLIRFTPSYASIQKHNQKFGKILPSAVYYENGELKSVGRNALLMFNRANSNGVIDKVTLKGGTGTNDGKTTLTGIKNTSSSSHGILLTSVKRIWGMDKVQIKDEIQNNKSFLDSCPFQTTWDDDNDELKIVICDDKKSKQKLSIGPIEVAEILLKTIREEATAYFLRERRKNKYHPLKICDTSSYENNYKVRHCIITVPAHFSRKQRDKIVNAARNAGFDGYINTLVESTAASMAYGLFVSPTKIIKQNLKDKFANNDRISDSCNVTKQEGRKIMVCDMGGGTTDITVADMLPSTNNDNGTEASFHVLGTAGERRLGGDDMDEALASFVVQNKLKNNSCCFDQSNKQEWNKLRMFCCQAKESLCGNVKDSLPQNEATISINDDISVIITQQEFCNVIQHLVDRVALLVEKTLQSCNCTYKSIDEVILVGGATRTPAIRKMLQSKFKKNELCYSIDADAAVAQGAAIQCAIISGLVPKHELRNALMLDALPHTIGVLVSTSNDDELYVPILESGMALPAMNYASFCLADIRQKGVTIMAVEGKF